MINGYLRHGLLLTCLCSLNFFDSGDRVVQSSRIKNVVTANAFDEVALIIGNVAVISEFDVVDSENASGWDLPLKNGVKISDPRLIAFDIDTTVTLEIQVELFLTGEYWSSKLDDDVMIALFIRPKGVEKYQWSKPKEGIHTVHVSDSTHGAFHGIKYFEFGYA